MSGYLPDPETADVAAAVERCFPQLCGESVAEVGRGWDYIAYEAGDHLLRVPRHQGAIARLPLERRLSALLGPRLPAPIPVINLLCEDGVDGRPLSGYRRVPGTSLQYLPPGERPQLGLELGAFLRSLHAVPVGIGLEAGLEGGASSEDWRRRQAQQYERVRGEAFPLLTAAACHYAESLYEEFLRDDTNFRFQPVILHADLYEDHVLVTEDGLHLSGVLDFGDASIGDPAWDFVWQLGGGEKNGAAVSLGRSGLEAHLDAYGPDARTYAARARFYELVWPFLVILGGIDLEQKSYVQHGLKQFEERTQTAGS